MKTLQVIIVGGGIGGLQTALALGADGHQVTVFEGAQEFMEVSSALCATPSSFLWRRTKACIGWCRHPCAAKLVASEPQLGRRFQYH
jgi:pyruvate/2-oxoglutarate dehydrogenase complex dihydrolipoamide dehydrogenase (E3) component